MYAHTTTITGQELIIKDNQLWIPKDELNADYREYLEWLAEGNEPQEWNPEEID